ncbi:uncharacterized protein LOC106077450 isoform X2 [Biomphalaria glabrata]|uniref:Uncharacterized protein LOC106077450 isoform X2 n=1 Tax=Biomphalaria glabrata TaxID=6526 RepID=A0A9W2ZAI9_BIOGL|nr:uncharacterized protein LOC106077450 isoform X2 [Biomphalaria glabrata]
MALCLHLLVALYVLSLSAATNLQNVTCQALDVTSEGIAINCTIEKVYPNAVYAIHITSNNVTAPNTSEVIEDCDPDSEHSCKEPCSKLCFYVLDPKLLGPGYHTFQIAAWNNCSDPQTSQSMSNIVDIPLPREVQEPVCDPPDFISSLGFHLGHVTCLAPMPYGHVSCVLNARTNGTILKYRLAVLNNGNLYSPSENRLKTFAVGCNLSLTDNHLGPGWQEFQVNMTTTYPDGKSSYKLSNWTTPVRYNLQTALNFTINNSPDVAHVNLGDNVTFVCLSDGYPPTDINIDHEPFASSFSYGSSYLEGTHLNYTITDCRQAGKYRCISTGRIKESDYKTKTMYLEIPCPLQYTSESSEHYIGDFSDTNRVLIHVLGSPGPKTMVLSRQDSGKAIISDGVSVTYTKDVGPFGDIAVEFSDHELIRKRAHFVLKVDNGIRNESMFEFTIQYNAGVSLMWEHMECVYLLYVLLSIIIVRA